MRIVEVMFLRALTFVVVEQLLVIAENLKEGETEFQKHENEKLNTWQVLSPRTKVNG